MMRRSKFWPGIEEKIMSSTKWLAGLLIIVAMVLGVMSMQSREESRSSNGDPSNTEPQFSSEEPSRTEPRSSSAVSSSEELMEADRVFAAETLSRGGNGWADFFARDGIMYPTSGRVDGREAIRETMLPVLAADQPLLRWEPESAAIAQSGDLGYTIGRWKSVGITSAGADTVLATGNYVTVWKRDEARQWRVALDIGNRDSE